MGFLVYQGHFQTLRQVAFAGARTSRPQVKMPCSFLTHMAYVKEEKKEASRLLFSERDARAPNSCVSPVEFRWRGVALLLAVRKAEDLSHKGCLSSWVQSVTVSQRPFGKSETNLTSGGIIAATLPGVEPPRQAQPPLAGRRNCQMPGLIFNRVTSVTITI